MVAMLSVAVSVLLLAPSAARGEETRLSVLSNDFNDDTLHFFAETRGGDGPLAAIHVDFYRGDSFNRRWSIDAATLQQGFSNDILSVKPDGNFDPATGGRLVVRYVKKVRFMKGDIWDMEELDLLKRDGSWILADIDGRRVGSIHLQNPVVFMSDDIDQIIVGSDPSLHDPMAAHTEAARTDQTWKQKGYSQLATRIQIDESKNQYIDIELKTSKTEGIGAIRFNAFINLGFGLDEFHHILSMDDLFSSFYGFELYRRETRVLVVRPIGDFNRQRGGRIAVSYSQGTVRPISLDSSWKEDLAQTMPNKRVILSLARGEDGRWVLEDETGRSISKLRIERGNFFYNGRPSKVMDVSEGRDATRLDRKIPRCDRVAANLLVRGPIRP